MHLAFIEEEYKLKKAKPNYPIKVLNKSLSVLEILHRKSHTFQTLNWTKDGNKTGVDMLNV